MSTIRSHRRRRASSLAGVVAIGALVLGPAAAAGAAPVSAGSASAYGVNAELGGTAVIEETPTAETQVGTEPVEETLVSVPADPIAVSGTFTASAAAQEPSDLPSLLEVNEQELAGPYNSRGFTRVEGLEVLLDTVEGDPLISASVVQSEAVGLCTGDAVEYSANSELASLVIGGEEVPVNGPLEEIVAGISDALEETTLDQLLDIEYNVVTPTADGIAVDALVITLLAAAGDPPLGEVRIGHAETSGLVCGAAAQPPECSDGIDNDGDGTIDHPDDPGCDSPEDDSEADGPAPAVAPECSDGTDNDGDGKIDHPDDPGCDSPEDDSEIDGPQTAPAALPETGGGSSAALAVGAVLAVASFGLHRFRSASAN